MEKIMFITKYKTQLGQTTLASDGENITGVWLEGQKYFGSTISKSPAIQDNLPVFKNTKDWLDRYFAKEKPLISELPLKPEGSDFRKSVWEILCHIPYGEVTTYGKIANILARKRNIQKISPQAVGGAVGHNPISIIIPCHRVIGANGNLTGYAGGIDTKIKLLELEGVDTASFFIPAKSSAV